MPCFDRFEGPGLGDVLVGDPRFLLPCLPDLRRPPSPSSSEMYSSGDSTSFSCTYSSSPSDSELRSFSEEEPDASALIILRVPSVSRLQALCCPFLMPLCPGPSCLLLKSGLLASSSCTLTSTGALSSACSLESSASGLPPSVASSLISSAISYGGAGSVPENSFPPPILLGPASPIMKIIIRKRLSSFFNLTSSLLSLVFFPPWGNFLFLRSSPGGPSLRSLRLFDIQILLKYTLADNRLSSPPGLYLVNSPFLCSLPPLGSFTLLIESSGIPFLSNISLPIIAEVRLLYRLALSLPTCTFLYSISSLESLRLLIGTSHSPFMTFFPLILFTIIRKFLSLASPLAVAVSASAVAPCPSCIAWPASGIPRTL